MIRKYVAGFLFSSSMGQVVLVEKNRPKWQAGRFNGVGGKVEKDETYYDAMVREFREETGRHIEGWKQFCTLQCPSNGPDGSAEVVFFYTVAEDYNRVESVTDEAITLWDVDSVMELHRDEILPNLRWLIQLARSFSKGEGAREFIVTEVYHTPTDNTLIAQPITRDSDVEKYKKTMQFLFDGWAAVRTARDIANEMGLVGTREEYNKAVRDYILSNPRLDLRDFGFLYIMLKKRNFPEEIVADIATYFERGATFVELSNAYKERT